jgi:hypothetical protein
MVATLAAGAQLAASQIDQLSAHGSVSLGSNTCDP